ncbi:MAG: hypothetical protein WD273_14995 [Trueperaceae bacterium]
MKRFSVIACLLCLSWLLSACAPTIRGSGVRVPMVVEPGEQVTAEQGSEAYLRIDYSLEEFGLSASDLSGTFWIPQGVDQESANVVTRFDLRNARVPAGWDLELAEIRAHRTTETRYGQETGTVTLRISPVLRLQVPADADLGESTVRAELFSRGGESRPIEIPVRVRAPAVR